MTAKGTSQGMKKKIFLNFMMNNLQNPLNKQNKQPASREYGCKPRTFI